MKDLDALLHELTDLDGKIKDLGNEREDLCKLLASSIAYEFDDCVDDMIKKQVDDADLIQKHVDELHETIADAGVVADNLLAVINDYEIGDTFDYYDVFYQYSREKIGLLQETRFIHCNKLYNLQNETFYFVPVKSFIDRNVWSAKNALKFRYPHYLAHHLAGPVYTNVIDALHDLTDKGNIYVFNKDFDLCDVIYNLSFFDNTYNTIKKYLDSSTIQTVENSSRFKKMSMEDKLCSDDEHVVYMKPLFKNLKPMNSKLYDYAVLTVIDGKYGLELECYKNISNVKKAYNFTDYKIGAKILESNPNYKFCE